MMRTSSRRWCCWLIALVMLGASGAAGAAAQDVQAQGAAATAEVSDRVAGAVDAAAQGAQDAAAQVQVETAGASAQGQVETQGAAADEAGAQPSGWTQWQKNIDTAFGNLNGYLAPVLFIDASFGVFDPELSEVEAELADAEAALHGLKSAPAEQRDARAIRLAQKAVDQLAAQRDALRAKADALELLKDTDALDRRRAALVAAGDEAALAAFDNEVEAAHAAAKTNVYALPLIVVFLLVGGVFFTLRFGLINLRLFAHSVAVIRGRYDNPKDHGEVTHFQALTAALSATVGLGNIAGVAIAINQGGAGAVFWMWFVAFFGMSSKFSSCTLAQMYRRISDEEVHHKKREHVLGGPMLYLSAGMKDVFGKAVGTPLGKVLAVMFAVFAIGGSLGGGNLFQGNQTFAIVSDVVFSQPVKGEDALILRVEEGDAAAGKELRQLRAAAADRKEELKDTYDWVGGLVMAGLVGMVIVGGIRRIGEVTSRLVPAMCLFYVGVCGIIVLANFGEVPQLVHDIFAGAFSGEAMAWGGLMGVLVIGVKRGAFSNEAGLGSAAIAHSAAKTDEPVREGVVAMIGPFIDTIVVCTMTALAILVTGAHLEGSAGNFTNEGVGITASAFSSLAPWLTVALMAAVFIFAYSTMISWSYYGERASEYLFGKAGVWPFRAVFLLFVFLSPLLSLSNVIDFTDLLILSMAYPNILGMIFLSGKVSKAAKDYVRRLRSGEMKPAAADG